MPKLDTNAKNMPGHAARNKSGVLRKIRGDTQIGTLEERYGVEFGVRKDMGWDTFKNRLNIDSVREALKIARN